MELTNNDTVETIVKSQTRAIPLALDGKYFVIVSSEPNGTVKAKCLTSANGNKPSRNAIVSGRYQPSSNFTTHLKRVHPTIYTEYVKYKDSLEPKLKRSRQPQIPFPVTKESAYKCKSERLIVKFIVKSMSPLALVEHPDFIALIKGLNPEANSLSRKNLVSKIDYEFGRVIQSTKIALASAKWVCLTADIWSSRNRSLGITSLWLDTILQRKSASDKIIEKLNETMQNFNIQEKVLAIVTDNGSNFVKALKDYGINTFEDEADVDIDEVEMETDFKFDSEDFGETKLRHIRCASHTLSLVATKDVELTVGTQGKKYSSGKSTYKRIMQGALAKCSSLWNKASRSVQVAESIKAVTGKSVSRPVVTRWNSLFDAIRSLLEFKEKLNVFEIAGVEKLKPNEIIFLEEYNLAMEPVASALDILQSENEFYFGFLAPSIWRVVRQLEKQISNPSSNGFGAQIASDLKLGVNGRFEAILNLDTVLAKYEILSAILMPCFKLNWIPKNSRDAVKTYFIQEAIEFSTKFRIESKDSTERTELKSKWTDFFVEEEEMQTNSDQEPECQNIELQCLTYLDDSRETVDMLNDPKYSVLKCMFVCYNTAIPSSAPAERLFSYGGMVLRPRRSRLTDEMFEKLVILKLNDNM